MTRIYGRRGTTLVELMVAVTIFLIFIALLYPAFSFLQGRMASISDTEALSERGNRLLDYMAEKIRMTGFIIGSNPCITFCGETLVNSLVHAEGNPFDTITFLTAFPMETNEPNMPYLRVTAAAARNATTVAVNTTNVSTSSLTPAVGTNNAKSLVTFDVLKPTYPYGIARWNGTVYAVSASAGTALTFADDTVTSDVREDQLVQDINARSYVYAVRRYRFAANARRELQEIGWNSVCDTGGETLDLDGTAGPGNAWGGVDALQFEYILSSDTARFVPNPAHTDVTADDLPNVRSVRISLLIRAGFPTRGYTNTNSYQVGNLAAPLVFNDEYKRMLLTRVVDVRNMGLWRP